MKSIAMNKKYISRSASIASFLSLQSQSLLNKKWLNIFFIVGILFSVGFVNKVNAITYQEGYATVVGTSSINYASSSLILSTSGNCGSPYNNLPARCLTNNASPIGSMFKTYRGVYPDTSITSESGNLESLWSNSAVLTRSYSNNTTYPIGYEYWTAFNISSTTQHKAGGTWTHVDPIIYVRWNKDAYGIHILSSAPPTPPPADTSTKLISLNPYQDQILANGTTTISGTYYNQLAYYNKLIVNLSYVEPSVNIDFELSNATSKQYIFNVATSTSNQNFSTTTDNLISGRWLMNIVFSNNTDGYNSFNATTTSFVVGTTTTFFSDYLYSTTTSYGNTLTSCEEVLASSTTSILEKAPCWIVDRFVKSLQGLFYPNPTIIGLYQQDIESIKQRAPMIYAQQTPALLNTLYQTAVNGSGTPISVNVKFIPGKATSSITFISQAMLASTTLASTVKTSLSWVLWLMFLLTVYKIISSMFDDKTPNV